MESQSKTDQTGKAPYSAGDRVVIGFGFAFDWLKEWREFF